MRVPYVVLAAPLLVAPAGPASLLREGGTSLMIHEGVDDYVSDPAGDAGPRIACGVIRPSS
jgi:superoxide dismutase, Cu-Zn family